MDLELEVAVLIISLWNSISNGLLLICLVANRDKKWPDFSINISALTVNAFCQGICGILESVFAVTEIKSVTVWSFPLTIAIFFSVLGQVSLQTFFIFVQRCLAFFRNGFILTKKYIVGIHFGTLCIASVIICVVLSSGLVDITEIREYSLHNISSSNDVVVYLSLITGLPSLVSYLSYAVLLYVVKSRIKRVMPASKPDAYYMSKRVYSILPIYQIQAMPHIKKSVSSTNFSSLDNGHKPSKMYTRWATRPNRSSVLVTNREYVDFAHRHPERKMPSVGSSGVYTAKRQNTSTCLDANLISTKCATGSKRTLLKEHVQSSVIATVSANESKRFSMIKNSCGKRFHRSQTKALKTMGYFMLANTTAPLLFMLSGSLCWIYPEVYSIQLMFHVCFVLLYGNTSFNVFIFVNRYKVIKDAFLKMLYNWKLESLEKLYCRSRHNLKDDKT